MLTEIKLTPTSSALLLDHRRDSIVGCSWGHVSEAKAVVLLVHGLGAHSLWFEALARQLEICGLYSVAYDQVGFGKRRQDQFITYKQWVDDLICVFKHVKATVGNKPVYILGNSLGGVVALSACKHITPDGLVLLSPALAGYPKVFSLMYKLTRDSATRAWLNADQDCQFVISGRMLLEVRKLVNSIASQCPVLKMPLFVLTAGADTIVDNEVIERFLARVIVPAKRFRKFSNAFHDLTLDYTVDEVAQEVVSWILANAVNNQVTSLQANK